MSPGPAGVAGAPPTFPAFKLAVLPPSHQSPAQRAQPAGTCRPYSSVAVRGGRNATCRATVAPPSMTLYAPGGVAKEGQSKTVPRERIPALQPGDLQALHGQKHTCYVEQFRIRGGEVGPDQVASASTIVGLLQETGGNHSVMLWGRGEQGFATAREMGSLILVMTKLSLRMRRYPRWGDCVEVMTYWKVKGKVGAVREWTIVDAHTKEVLGTGTSSWVMVNTETRRIARIPQVMLDQFLPYSPDEYLAMPLRPDDLGDIPALMEDDRCRATKHTVRVTDTDMNAHINNVIYVSWVVSTTPPAAMNGRRLQQLDIEYKRECRMGEGEVLCLCRPADDGTGSYIYSLQETASNRGPASEFARARCVFADN